MSAKTHALRKVVKNRKNKRALLLYTVELRYKEPVYIRLLPRSPYLTRKQTTVCNPGPRKPAFLKKKWAQHLESDCSSTWPKLGEAGMQGD